MIKSPIILFTYNRPDHTRLTVEALQANIGALDSDLFIYSDGAKNDQHTESVRRVRDYLRTIDGFRTVTVVERAHNLGLAKSIIAGVTELLDRNNSVIVLEDDMITAPDFLLFMNSALAVYADRQDIFSVTGYNYPLAIPDTYRKDAYLSYRSSSWGWGTWTNRWQKVDWAVSDFAQFLRSSTELALFARGGEDLLPMLKLQMQGMLDSWSIRFDYAHYKYNATCLHPVRSKVQNIGFDGSGVHCSVSDNYDVVLDLESRPFTLDQNLQIDQEILQIFDVRFRPKETRAATEQKSKPKILLLMKSILGLFRQATPATKGDE